VFLCTFLFTPGLRIPYDAVVNARLSPLAAVAREPKRNIGRIGFSKKGAIWQQQK
jgi:hypothetical protein